MGLQRIPAQKFGGLNTVEAPYDLPPGMSPDLLNVTPTTWDDDESIEQRGGMKDFTGGAAISNTGTYVPSWPLVGGSPDGYGDTLWWGNTATDGIAFFTKDGTQNNGLVRRGVSGGASDSYCSAIAYPSGGPDAQLYLLPRGGGGAIERKIWNGLTGVLSTWSAGTTNLPVEALSMVYWRGRLVALDEVNVNRILYTNVGDPNNWGNPANFIDIFDQETTRNCQLVVHNNNLYLFKAGSVWMIYDPNSFANRMIAPVGTGANGNLKGACSSPHDKRLYWVDTSTGALWSSNGETDLIRENSAAPLTGYLESKEGGVLGFWFILSTVYDDKRRAILVAYNRSAASLNSGQYNDTVDEIVLRGKPGQHPIFRHRMDTYGWVADVPFEGSATNPKQMTLTAGINDFKRVLIPFVNVGYDDQTSFPITNAHWQGPWMPIISEEPWERIRRINCLYRGTPTIKVTSAMDPRTATAVSLTSALANPALTGLDRTFLSIKGPNKKGRYHRLQVDGPGVQGQDFALSAVEFAIRGGKGKK